MNIAETVIRIIAQENHLEPDSVTLDSTFAELGIDSLDGVNILFALESEMNITIPDTVARNMTSVRQVVDSLTRVVNGQDISDLVAMAQQATPAQQAATAA
jgi:acyl carrier protein